MKRFIIIFIKGIIQQNEMRMICRVWRRSSMLIHELRKDDTEHALNNQVKSIPIRYVQKDLTKEEAEYLILFEEEIGEGRLKHRRHMRRWEMFGNGRPLRSRKERPE
ncbi:hypothetical protein Tco_1096472 [Tanacetum coccineum]